MKKIASPQELSSEIRQLLAVCQGSERPSREKLARRLHRLANQVQGKVANLTDDDTLEQLIDMEIESLGEGDLSNVPTQDMQDVEKAAYTYENAIEKTLLGWIKPNLAKLRMGERGPLQRARTPNDVIDVMLNLRGGASYFYFMEAEGHGVGTWDGDWDPMFVDPRSTIKELSRYVESKTKGQYRQLKTAIENAAFSAQA